jgi:hypothetical protein
MPGGPLDREEDAEKPLALAGRSNHIHADIALYLILALRLLRSPSLLA